MLTHAPFSDTSKKNGTSSLQIHPVDPKIRTTNTMNSRYLASCLLVGLLLSPHAIAKKNRGLTALQLLSIRSVRGATISANGEHVAFTVSKARGDDEKTGAAHKAVWVLRYGAGQARRFTPENGSVSGIGFTPDSKRLTFLTKRGKDAKHQLWWMALDGGEAEALTDAKEGVSDYEFSPDGSQLAYLTSAPQSKERAAAEKKGFDEVVVHKNPRHHQLRVRNIHSKQEWLISPADKTVFEFSWSPNGKEMLIMQGDSPRSDDNLMFRSLWRIPVDNNPKTTGTRLAHKMGKMVQPGWSPKGTRIAWRGASVKNDATNGTIWYLPAKGGTPRAMNSGALETVYDMDWLTEDELLVTAVKGTQTELSRRNLNGTSHVIKSAGATFLSVDIDKAGKKIVFIGSTGTEPHDLYTGELNGVIGRTLEHNPQLKGVQWAKQETVEWKV